MTTSGDPRIKNLQFLVKSVASAALFLCLAAGCSQPPAEPALEQVEFTGAIMGTTYHIKIAAAMTDSESTEAAQVIEETLKRVDGKMSTYKADSEISRLNAATGGSAIALSEETFDLIALSQRINSESDGAFDITVGPLVNAWGFGPTNPDERPTDEALVALSALTGPDKITLDATTRTVTKAAEGVYCDLSAIAKGYAVDEVASTIAQRGYANFMVEIGGEVRTAGLNGRGIAWKIAIEKPVDEERALEHVVGLSDVALATSGNYRNFYEAGGKRLSHTIDPKSGRPVEHSLASASVIHPECALADAYATAIMVLGPEKGLVFAEMLGLPALLIIHGDDGQLTTRETASFAKYVMPK